MTDRIEFESARPAGPPSAEVRWFWLMTVQVQTPGGLQQLTREGTVGLVAGRDTRESAYQLLLATMREQAGVGAGHPIVVLAYTLEPNALGGAL